MERLRLLSNERIRRTSLDYRRDEWRDFDWTLRLMGIKGARGVGKTTLLLQHLKQTHGLDTRALYISLDDIAFANKRLVDVAAQFYREGGLHLYLDEVHKYPDWAIEIKNLYDTYPDLQIIFTGSAMLEIHRGHADLSRRAIVFHLQGLSFRQYLALGHGIHLPVWSLEDILDRGNACIAALPQDFRPYPFFRDYLRHGYYPFFTEGERWFYDRLLGTMAAVLESDLPLIKHIDIHNLRHIQKLLLAIATSPPFKPNIQRLSERTGLARNTLLQYLYYLEEADLLALLQAQGKGLHRLQKPDKLYLENTNLLYAIAPDQVHIGMVRETFVFNQLRYRYQVHEPKQGDFFVENTHLLEVGGAGKGRKQLAGEPQGYVIADDLDDVVDRKIPIWMLGMLY